MTTSTSAIKTENALPDTIGQTFAGMKPVCVSEDIVMAAYTKNRSRLEKYGQMAD
jgi:hypothetical protein